MKNKHLKLEELTYYFLNKLTRDNETKVQEHLSACEECRKKLSDMRLLKESIAASTSLDASKTSPIFKILSSSWVRYSAAAVLIIGVGLGFYLKDDSGYSIVKEGIVPETILSTDSLTTKDSTYYYCPTHAEELEK